MRLFCFYFVILWVCADVECLFLVWFAIRQLLQALLYYTASLQRCHGGRSFLCLCKETEPKKHTPINWPSASREQLLKLGGIQTRFAQTIRYRTYLIRVTQEQLPTSLAPQLKQIFSAVSKGLLKSTLRLVRDIRNGIAAGMQYSRAVPGAAAEWQTKIHLRD